MAITNDERRQVAARLRSVSGAPEWATTACCIAECLGEHDYPLWDDSKPLFNRLADLIEPEPERTCRAIPRKNEFGHNDLHCSKCHHLMQVQRDGSEKPPKFCDECGARVVD